VPGDHPFPLNPGTSWLYEGTVRLTTAGSDSATTATVEWRMEVRRLIQHGNVRAAIISGFLSELDWSDGRRQPQDSLLVESADRFYRITGDLAEPIRRLEQPSDDLAGLLQDDNVILQWPLKPHMKFCAAEGMARPDNRYCWVVAETRASSPLRIKGVPRGKHTEFVLQYQTNPDDTEFSFVPDVGITSYSYHHHGTVADTELKLVEFRPPSREKQ
jgi:hypothetical protein